MNDISINTEENRLGCWLVRFLKNGEKILRRFLKSGRTDNIAKNDNYDFLELWNFINAIGTYCYLIHIDFAVLYILIIYYFTM